MSRSALTTALIGCGAEVDRIAGLLKEHCTTLARHTTYTDAEELFIEAVSEGKPLVCVRVAGAAEEDVAALTDEVKSLEIKIRPSEKPGRSGEAVHLGNSLDCPQIRFLFVTGKPYVRLHQVRSLLRMNIADVLPLDVTAEALAVAISRAMLCLPKSPDRLWGSGIVHNVVNILMALPGALDLNDSEAQGFVRTLIELRLLAEQLDALVLPQEPPTGETP